MIEKVPTFFIKKNSTLPILKYPLNEWILKKYDISEEMLENCAITFSMYNVENEEYKIANKGAKLDINDVARYPDEDKYSLGYKFLINDTIKPGIYCGEFKVDFLGNHCGCITFPVDKHIKIVISESITKTEVLVRPITEEITVSDSFDYTLDFDL